jgi:hypothetical protein
MHAASIDTSKKRLIFSSPKGLIPCICYLYLPLNGAWLNMVGGQAYLLTVWTRDR